MGKKKFYAVARGRRTGIFTKWFGPGGAEAQVKGVAGARFKGFGTRQEAERFLREPPESRPVRAAAPRKVARGAHLPSEDDGSSPGIRLYTDGGALGNPGPGGYGVVQVQDGQRSEQSGGYRLTTNNRMELMACIAGLSALDGSCPVALFSDSKYVVDAMRKGWARRWRDNSWMRTKSEPARNADLWARLLELCERRQVTFNWVKGHAGHPENERCDQLAKQAAGGSGLGPDSGYEREKRAGVKSSKE